MRRTFAPPPPPRPQPCQRSKSNAMLFKTRNESSSALPFGRPPTSHGTKNLKQFNFNSVRETRNTFAPRNKLSSYNKVPSRLHLNNPIPLRVAGSSRFLADPSYDSSLGGVALLNKFEHSKGYSGSALPLSAPQSSSCRSTTLSSTFKIPYAPSQSVRTMVSHSQTQLTLMEQKKRQWAQEREELSGLWSPWGKDSNKSLAQNYAPDKNEGPSSSTLSRPMGNFAQYSSSDHYLPPINDNGHNQQNLRLAQRSHSLIPVQDIARDFTERKGSLQNNEGRRMVQLQPYEHRTTFHKQGNAEWMIIHNGNGTEGADDGNSLTPNGDGHRTAVVSPRVIVHKIVMDASEERTLSRKVRDTLTDADLTYASQASAQGKREEYGAGDYGGQLTQNTFKGSTGSIGVNKPPPVAMRSSLTIGLPSPRSRFGGSFEDIEKKEKEQWLYELEKQREEQRMRKLMEKDEKRARWGDRGVGVGHFWEPSDSSRARLPSRDSDSHDRLGTAGVASPPGWAKRSLEIQNSSRSQPNLYHGPMPTQLNIEAENARISSSHGLSQGHIANFNRSSIELSSRSRSPFQTHTDMVDSNRNYGDDGEPQRSFLRGQNIPLDPNEMLEKERKAKARQEYLSEVKQQIEDNKRRQQNEKERQQREDREHEIRMERQQELELKRLEMEKNKKNNNSSSDSTTKQETETGMQIFEGRRKHPEVRESDAPLHESPLIPNRYVPGPDAYEMAIARRQVKTLVESQSQFTEKSETASLSSETGMSGNNFVQRSTTSTPPTVVESRIENAMPMHTIDQSLMTDSDHIYQRILTPTVERRSRSIETARSREFGTQTEVSDITTDAETDRDAFQNKNSQLSKRSRSIATMQDKKDEKPRWGSNPEKKVYLKQSEKDPNYHKNMRRRQLGNDLTGETDTTFENENERSVPFHRIQNRARTRERDRLRKSKSPLKGFASNTSHNFPAHGQSHSQSHISAHLKTDKGLNASRENVSSLNKIKANKTKNRSPQKIVRKDVDPIQSIKGRPHYPDTSNIAQKHLGHIGDGLNSVGGSEESGTGSGFTSPSMLIRKTHCSTGESNSSLPSSASNSDYVPMFSTEFKTQREFDEIPISGGIKANPYLNLEKELHTDIVHPTVKNSVGNVKPISIRRLIPTGTKPKSRKNDIKNVNGISKSNSLEERQNFTVEHQRLLSPPVPALANKMEMGLRPDESGRLSSLPPDLLSPIPVIPLGTMASYTPQLDFEPSITDGSRISSAEPKVDIDIAITHSSNPDFQILLQNMEQSAAALTSRTDISHPSLLSARMDELSQTPMEFISPRSAVSASRPVTNATEFSLQAQEEFIHNLMGRKEVQQQLSAREGELAENGITEFNIQLPKSFLQNALGSGKNRTISNRSRDTLMDSQLLYRDPLIVSRADRRKATAQWLHGIEGPSSHKDAILTNLSSLKQGIRMQQELVHVSDSYH